MADSQIRKTRQNDKHFSCDNAENGSGGRTIQCRYLICSIFNCLQQGKTDPQWLGFWYTDNRTFLAKNISSLLFKMNNKISVWNQIRWKSLVCEFLTSAKFHTCHTLSRKRVNEALSDTCELDLFTSQWIEKQDCHLYQEILSNPPWPSVFKCIEPQTPQFQTRIRVAIHLQCM